MFLGFLWSNQVLSFCINLWCWCKFWLIWIEGINTQNTNIIQNTKYKYNTKYKIQITPILENLQGLQQPQLVRYVIKRVQIGVNTLDYLYYSYQAQGKLIRQEKDANNIINSAILRFIFVSIRSCDLQSRGYVNKQRRTL